MVTYGLCPLLDFIEVGAGRQRNARYVPVGIKISNELNDVGGIETRHF